MTSHKTSIHILQATVAFIATVAFASCFNHTAHFEYRDTHLKGWHRSEMMEYDVTPVEQTGYYIEEIGVRANHGFPYERLRLEVEQEIISTTNHQRHLSLRDTISIAIYDAGGTPTGDGVNLRQYQVPLKNVKLLAGDSLHVSIRHDMRSPSIKGIANVGFRLYEN